ncbi:MAG: hypothetical protein HY650_10625 [Acidobacteria bacterium]|nr:hypothetical protein [Acidobacteriota bacterium]
MRGRSGSYHELIEGQEAGVKARSLDEVLDAFEVRLKWYVAQMARRRVFVHAGVVGWNGQAIVIPGRSMSGKTSLVAELVRAGASYYSDEFAVLDLKGHVHPYPQRLEIRTDGSNRQEKYRIEDIGGIPGTKPVPVGLIAICQYRASARWRPARLSPGQAVLELLANTMPARRKPEVVIPTLRRAVSNVTILKGVRGEAGDVALNILKACEPRLSD